MKTAKSQKKEQRKSKASINFREKK